jgi:hypothetical protein
MARINDVSLTQQTGLTLDRYQEILGLPIAAFNGLNKPGETPVYACTTIWTQTNRDNLARFLAIAEEKREQELGYFIAPKYLEDEEHSIMNPLILDKKFLISIGKKVVTVVEDDVTITYRDGLGAILDTITISITTALITTYSEVDVRYHDEDVPIHPSSVTVSGGVVTIKIPRARLVKPELNDDREDTLKYDEDDNFVTTVDVKKVVYNTADGIHYITFGTSYAETDTLGYALVNNLRLSVIELNLYAQSCTFSLPICNSGILPCSTTSDPIVRVSYLSGRQNSIMTDMQTLRLAHCLMPFEPCGCEAEQQYWRDDVTENNQDIITPYGTKNGAVEAWVADSRSKVGQGGKFPSMR